jgi:hypothetical protein
MRAKSRAPKNQFRERIQAGWGCQSRPKNISFRKPENSALRKSEDVHTVALSRLDKRGVRVVTNVGRDAMDVEVPLTSGAKADGEIVWS